MIDIDEQILSALRTRSPQDRPMTIGDFARQFGASRPVIVSAVRRLVDERPTYGYRRITAQVQREGITVNHKRVLRLMREDNLLCLRKRRFIVTTDSAHGLPVYPNLVSTLSVTGINQLWLSDITYVRLQSEFIYLAVILDGFSQIVSIPDWYDW